MAKKIQTTSPAGNFAPIEGRIRLRALPCCGKVNLRGAPDDEKFLDAAREVLGMPLPLAANTTSVAADGDARMLFWLGPDEWLLHCKLARAENILSQLHKQLAGLHYAATDVTDYYTVLELAGAQTDEDGDGRNEHAAAVLARGCPLDLHERAFKATQCAQTRFGNASVLLYKPDAEPLFQIQTRWSFTGYVWEYIATVIKSL